MVKEIRRWRATATVAAAAGLALALAGCGGGAGNSAGSAGPSRVVVIGQANEPRSLEAGYSSAQAEINIGEQINEKLMEFTADGKGFEPRLATSWKSTSPGVLEVSLRKDVTFTNGEPFDADSALFSAEAMKNSHDFDDFTSDFTKITKVDDHTIDVAYKGAESQALTALAMSSFQYPKKYYAEVGKDKFGTAPIGTGPFVYKAWDKGVDVTMDANKKYWGGAPKAKGLQFTFFSDMNAALSALQSGSVDLVFQPPIGSLPVLQNSNSLKLISAPGGRLWSLNFSKFSKTPITNQQVRLALQHAIDTKSLIKNQMAGQARSAHGQYAPDNAVGWNPDIQQPSYDPQLAKKMLAEAGQSNLHLTFQYATRDSLVAQAIASQLEAVGVTVTQEGLETGTYLTKMGPPQELNDFWLGGALTPPDAAYALSSYTSNFWYGYYANPEFDKVFGAASKATDDKERIKLLQQAGQILADDPPGVPLYVSNDLYGVTKKLQGFTPHSTQFIDARSLSVGQ